MAHTGTAQTYRVFVRNWWRWDTGGVGPYFSKKRSLVPDPSARKTTLARHCTEEEAKALCHRYQETHNPGPLSRKAEYERE